LDTATKAPSPQARGAATGPAVGLPQKGTRGGGKILEEGTNSKRGPMLWPMGGIGGTKGSRSTGVKAPGAIERGSHEKKGEDPQGKGGRAGALKKRIDQAKEKTHPP